MCLAHIELLERLESFNLNSICMLDNHFHEIGFDKLASLHERTCKFAHTVVTANEQILELMSCRKVANVVAAQGPCTHDADCAKKP